MAQEQRRTGDQPERRSRASGRSRTTQNRGGRKKGRAATSFALLYVVFVIGISALLACIGWVAANDPAGLYRLGGGQRCAGPEQRAENGYRYHFQ